jgi:hypothetical protein
VVVGVPVVSAELLKRLEEASAEKVCVEHAEVCSRLADELLPLAWCLLLRRPRRPYGQPWRSTCNLGVR